MANTQAAFGFRHIGYLSGGAPDYQQRPRQILSTNTTKIFLGDPVVRNPSTGQIEQAANNTTQIDGVFAGCWFIPTSGLAVPQWSPFWPGGAAQNARGYVIDAPNAEFLVAVTNTAITLANVGENVGFAIGTGSTVGAGLSGATVDQSTLTTATTAPFKIIGLYDGIGNGSDAASAYNWVRVGFNYEWLRSQTGIA